MSQPSIVKGQAFVLHAKHDARFMTLDPNAITPGDLDVIVSPRKTGICGSDVHLYKHGRVGEYRVKAPMVLGHESAGVVVQVGRNVTGLQIGDRVALEPGETCGICSLCKEGKYHLCPRMIFAATPPHHGTLQSFYKLSHHLCYKLPQSMSLEDGAMIEPLAVAVHAVTSVGKLRGNQNVVIFGAGPVGLLAMATCKALSARRIVAVDVLQERLTFAKHYAATDIWEPVTQIASEPMSAFANRNAKEMCKSLGLNSSVNGSDGVDLVLDCAGVEASIQTAIHIAKPGATIVQVGVGSEYPPIPLVTLIFKELKYLGSCRYGPGVYKMAIDLVRQGKISLAPLVTHRYSFEDADKAFRAMVTNRGYDGKPPIKVIINGPGEHE